MSDYEARAELRVILVGRTGLDGELRRESLFELARARTAMDAMGELSDPIDVESPARSVVIVDPEAEPSGEGPGDLGEFLGGLRRLDEGVRVLRVARNGAPVPEGYDGAIRAGQACAALRALAQGDEGTDHVQEAADPGYGANGLSEGLSDGVSGGLSEEMTAGGDDPAPAGDPIDAPVVRPTPDERHDSAGEEAEPCGALEADDAAVTVCADETGLLRRLAAGEPVLPAALDVLRRRCGGCDISFQGAGEESDDSDDSWDSWSSARVTAGGDVAGRLRSRELGPRELESHASWLGAWLELEAKQASLREAAYTDSVTGAFNRRYFDEFFPRAIADAKRDRRSLTLLLFDIDDFKRFNDDHGHAAGDEILTECVRLLRATVRPTDKVCRIGGDEFAVIFHEPEGPREPTSQHPSSVYDIAQRFCVHVRSARFRKLGDDAPGKLTISGGLATFPWDGVTPCDLVARADELALEGKRSGKNVITIGPGCRRGEGAG